MSTSSSEPAPSPYRTLTQALLAAPHERPFATMWGCEGDTESVSFGEFRGRVAAEAAMLEEFGVRAGDTVIIIMRQGITLMASFVGAMAIGAAPAILAYPTFKTEPGKYRSGIAGVSANLMARLVLVDEAYPEELLAYVRKGDDTRIVRHVDSAASRAAEAILARSLGGNDLAFIQHSAGTTGLQKGVALSHAAVLRQLGHLAAVLKLCDDDRIYSWLPLYHDMGLVACFMLPMVYHLPVIMQSPAGWVMQPGTMLELITKFACTLAWAPNFTFQFMARHVSPENRVGFDLSSVRALISCSEPVRAASMDEFRAAYEPYGLKSSALHTSYAMAENVFAVTQSEIASREPPSRVYVDAARLSAEHVAVPVSETATNSVCFVSSGRCLPGNQVRIVSAAGDHLVPGGVGEILVHSDSLFEGYYNRSELTAKALKNGWFASGDLGFIRDGELYVTGRKSDLIIVAGKNIYPQDVEEIVSSHPDVRDGRVVAFGLYNPALGTEEVVAIAELEDATSRSAIASIEATVRSRIAAELGIRLRTLYFKPARWLVKSTAGKPARAATRDKLLLEHPELAAGAAEGRV